MASRARGVVALLASEGPERLASECANSPLRIQVCACGRGGQRSERAGAAPAAARRQASARTKPICGLAGGCLKWRRFGEAESRPGGRPGGGARPWGASARTRSQQTRWARAPARAAPPGGPRRTSERESWHEMREIDGWIRWPDDVNGESGASERIANARDLIYWAHYVDLATEIMREYTYEYIYR